MSKQRNDGADVPREIRRAVYSRKGTAAGLEQEFNSLDAQRAACVSYAEQQRGWVVANERGDAGDSADVERPALQRLLQDVESRRIDIVLEVPTEDSA